MDHLPWLVVHGPLAFRLAAFGATALGLALVWLAARARALWQARQAREALGDPGATTALEEGATVTIGGVLEAGGAPCARFEDGAPCAAASVAFDRGALRRSDRWKTAASARAETLAVLTEDARFEFAGEIEVVAGSHEAWPGLSLARLAKAIRDRVLALPQRASPAFVARPAALRSITGGERVRVRGVLRREPRTDRSATYRDTRTHWILSPPLSLAFDGRPRVRGPSWRILCRGAGAAAILFIAIASLAGEIATRVAVSPGPPGRAARASLLAAASPIHRERALTMLGATLSLRCLEDYSRDQLEQEVAVAELQGDCEHAAGALFRHGQLERAADTARRCGAFRVAAHADYLRGHFDLASEDLERGRAERDALPLGEAHADAIFGARVHLFAGRADLAAIDARRAARLVFDLDRVSLEDRFKERRGQVLTCLAEALEARANHAAPAASVRDGDESAAMCGQLLADVGLGEARRPPMGYGDKLGWILYLEDRLGRRDESFVTQQCLATDIEAPVILDHPSRLFGPVGALDAMDFPPAVLKRSLERLARRPGTCAARGELAAAMAVFEAWSGEHREARRWAEQVMADFPRGSDRGERAQVFQAAIELYAGDAAQARALLEGISDSADDVRELRWMIDIRDKGDLALLSAPQEKLGALLHGPRRAEPWSLTSQGDGTRLAAWLQRHDTEGVGAYLLLGAPHLTRGREELLAWFRWGDRSECYSCAPALPLFDAASRESAVDLLGDRGMAGDLAFVAWAFHRALMVRETAVPIAMIDAL